MSNSIWKTPDQKPKKENHIVLVGAWATCLWYGGEKPEEIFWENVKRWAYLEDLITQADKAEQLQKAVDLAVHSFNEIRAGVPNDKWVFDEATKATNKIEQLIKENQ